MISPWNSRKIGIACIVATCGLLAPKGSVALASPQDTAAKMITLHDGTPVHLYLMDDLTSKKSKDGDIVRFKVREDARVDDVVIIAAGSAVTGHVVAVRRRGFAGRSGKLDLAVDYALAVNGSKIPLRGNPALTGASNGEAAAAGAAAIVLIMPVATPAALLIRGSDADIHKGTMLNAYVNGDQVVSVGR